MRESLQYFFLCFFYEHWTRKWLMLVSNPNKLHALRQYNNKMHKICFEYSDTCSCWLCLFKLFIFIILFYYYFIYFLSLYILFIPYINYFLVFLFCSNPMDGRCIDGVKRFICLIFVTKQDASRRGGIFVILREQSIFRDIW